MHNWTKPGRVKISTNPVQQKITEPNRHAGALPEEEKGDGDGDRLCYRGADVQNQWPVMQVIVMGVTGARLVALNWKMTKMGGG